MRYEISDDGQRLTILLDDETERRALQRDEDSDGFHSDSYLTEFLELLVNDSELEWVLPEQIGALTSAPLLGIIPHNDDGYPDFEDERVQVWGFEPYQVRSVQQDLLETGKAVFRASW